MKTFPNSWRWVDKLVPADWYKKQRDAIRKVIDEKNNWYQLILELYELDAGVRKTFFQNFLFMPA